MLEYLANNPLLALFLFLGLGMAVGHIKVRGVSLGAAAVLFLAIAVSAAAHTQGVEILIPAEVGHLGLATLTFAIGMASGPNFFHVIKTAAGPLVVLVAVIVAAGGVALATGRAFGLSTPVIAGTFAGAVTNTPALAAASVGHPEATVGYAVSYLFGVLGMLGFALLALSKASGDTDEPSPVINRTIRVERDDNPSLQSLQVLSHGELTFSRLRRGEQGPILQPHPGDVVYQGDLITVVGTQDAVEYCTKVLGHPSSHSLMVERKDLDFRRITVSNPRLFGRTIGQLDVDARFGATISRVRRGDVDMIAADSIILQPGDRVRVVFPAGKLSEISAYFGDSSRGLTSITPVAFGVGMALGILLGQVPVPLPSGTFTLGAAGGTLLVGLVFGRIGRIGRFATTMPFTSTQVLSEFGLLLFLAQAGARAGGMISQAFEGGDWWKIFLVGAAVTTTMGAGMYLGMRLLVGMGGTRLSGVLGGAQTQPAVLAFANERTGADPRVALGYAMVFPVAMIAKILVAQILSMM